jgi:hypothetical protein
VVFNHTIRIRNYLLFSLKNIRSIPPAFPNVRMSLRLVDFFSRVKPGSIDGFIEGQAFSPSNDVTPRPPPPPPPFSFFRQKARPATHRKTEKEGQLADGRWGDRVWEEPNHTTPRKPGPQ